MDTDLEPKFISLYLALICDQHTESEFTSLTIETISLVSSMDLDSQPKPESQLMSLLSQAISVFSFMDLDSQPKPLSDLISIISQNMSGVNSIDSCSEFVSLVNEVLSLDPKPELILVIDQIYTLFGTMKPEPRLISLVSQLLFGDNTELESSSFIIQIITLVSSMDLDSQPKPESQFMSLVSQAISVFNSMDLDSQPKPLSDLISVISQTISAANSKDPYPELLTLVNETWNLDPTPELISLIDQIRSLSMFVHVEPEEELISLITQLLNEESERTPLMFQIVSFIGSVDFDSQPKPMSKLMSLVRLARAQAISDFDYLALYSQPQPLSELMYFFSRNTSLLNSKYSESEFMSLVGEALSLDPEPQLISLINHIHSLFVIVEPEQKLISLITKLLPSFQVTRRNIPVLPCVQLISFVMSMDMDSQLKPESELMSLINQAISVVSSMDFDSQPKPLTDLISFMSESVHVFNSMDFDSQIKPPWEVISLIGQNIVFDDLSTRDIDKKMTDKLSSLIKETSLLKPEPELVSLIHQILSIVIHINVKLKKLIAWCPQVEGIFEEGKFYEKVLPERNNKWDCVGSSWQCFNDTSPGTHFFCSNCNGQNHEEYEKAPVEIKHPLHPKHFVKLVWFTTYEASCYCYCCEKKLFEATYYCSACDLAMHFTCAEKPPVLFRDDPKWHEHKLALFPSLASFTCNICALKHTRCPFYICPPCDFVVHQSCLSLPRVIRISRHLHRISFTSSFGNEDWSCGVCRKKIDNDHGGYSCIKDSCSYVVHSRCATQVNVWDGVDLEGEPEEMEEEVLEPFVRISDGIIQHFSHEHHHLRLDEYTNRDYNDTKLCQACVTPIYYGNFYYCLQCDDFILHETCANLPRTTYHPLHPHLLTLMTNNGCVIDTDSCSTCPWLCAGFFYECTWSGGMACNFKVHVGCGTISEPLVHKSHPHPLFLTSKPGEQRTCGVCNDSGRVRAEKWYTSETFNCIECDFALCFGCAIVPQMVRYKHDKHMLTLSYGEESSTTTYWCEICEQKVNPKERFYKCEEYCCVTLHIECLVENDLYMKPGLTLSYSHYANDIEVLRNHGMSRPFCSHCGYGKRCPYKYFYMFRWSVYCSLSELF